MAMESGRLSPMRGVRWLSSMGLLAPLVVGLGLLILVGMTLVSNLYEAPQVITAGNVDEFTFGEPVQFEDEDFWLTKQPDGSFLALYERDPVSGCTLGFDGGHQLLGNRGWFRDACTGSTYDLVGGCFDGPCEVGLNRYELKIENNEVIVDPMPDKGTHGPLRTENGDPVNPP